MGTSAEQIIAGVVLGERLAVTMYGGIHRAQHAGQKNLRGLIVDAKMLAEEGFRRALTDSKGIQSAIALEHPNIVPAVTVESEGADVVVVTRGTGRYVTVHDLLAAARATKAKKLAPEITALVGKCVVEALATAHKAGVVHGAVHPRSVLIDEVGDVRLGDFVVGRALTTAVAQGADSSLWRGLAGYIAPELVVGEDPTPAVDVFAVGALLFTLLTGEVQPGPLHVTPAVERLVTRALDTDVSRRYKNASALLENLLEAFEDDRWTIASKAELVKAAGLAAADANIDDATEDLLASLGSSAIQVTPTRPSMDIRAESIAARHQKTPGQQTTGGRLDALLADLGDDATGMTHVDEEPMRRDPVSEIIKLDPRRAEAIVSSSAPGRRVPSLDDPDEEDPPPEPAKRAPSPAAGNNNGKLPRSRSMDEAAAFDALGGLDEPVRRVSTAAERADAAAERLENAARRAEAALDSGPVKRISTASIIGEQPTNDATLRTPRKPSVPIVDPIHPEPPNVSLASPTKRIVTGIVVIAVIGVAGYLVYSNFAKQDDIAATDKAKHDKDVADQEARLAKEKKAKEEALADPGAIAIKTNPAPAGVWLRLGKTPFDTMRLSPASSHEIAFVKDGFAVTHGQVLASNWAPVDDKGNRKATFTISLAPPPPPPDPKVKIDPKKYQPPGELPIQPPAIHQLQPKEPGAGSIHVESTPPDAEAWLYIGNTAADVKFEQLTAGRPYELQIVKPGYQPKKIQIGAEDWRDGGDPSIPIDTAKKKDVIERNVDLDPVDPKAGKK